jgi:lysozyme
MSDGLSRARERLAARKKAVAAALTALRKLRAKVAETQRTIKRLSQPKAVKGIDVSNHQGAAVNFNTVKKVGYSFVYCKATEGLGFVDNTFHANVVRAQAAGLKVGAYHFLRPKAGRTGADEARAFIAELKRSGLGAGNLRPAIDVEVTAVSPAVTEAYVDSCARAMRAAGYDPLIYTFPAFLHWHSTHGCPLWIANFDVAKPTIPSPWKGYVIWQHSSTAKVPGVSGNCDVNRCPDLQKILA